VSFSTISFTCKYSIASSKLSFEFCVVGFVSTLHVHFDDANLS